MLTKSSIDKIIPVLRESAERAMTMKVKGFPRPYFCSFLLRDNKWFNTWAMAGSTVRKRSDHSRSVYCDLRVGSYRYDQTIEGGLHDNDEELESSNFVNVPVDDRYHGGLKIALWRLSEAKFREALSDMNSKESARLSTVDPNEKFASFSSEEVQQRIKYASRPKVDEVAWEKFCIKASRWMSRLPEITASWVEFECSHETKLFVSTEGSEIVQHQKIYSLSGFLRKLTKKGEQIEQSLVLNCSTDSELPSLAEFKKMILEKHSQLLKLAEAKKIHAFSGPVLLYPIPSGLLFHEAIGHRLEGSRLLSSGEGQTFKGQIDKKILNVPINFSDDPTKKKFKGKGCIGAYDFDDEGVPSQCSTLIESGVLKRFLTTRGAISKKDHQSNGHARNRAAERPISRMGVTIVEGEDPLPLERLREMLVEEINAQGKAFGMIVYQTSGGETDTANYDFQAFAGEISYATLIYPDGREEVVKGVDFVGTPLQALNNVLAVSSELELDNGFCGAESGFIPVSTISPAVLIRNLEMQVKNEELVTQYILPKPEIS